MWKSTCIDDPVPHHHSQQRRFHQNGASTSHSSMEYFVVNSEASFDSILGEFEIKKAFQEGGRPARVALADFCARTLLASFRKKLLATQHPSSGYQVSLEPLDFAGSRRRKLSNFNGNHTPYVLERTDVWSTEETINVMLRACVTLSKNDSNNEDETKGEISQRKGPYSRMEIETAASHILENVLGANVNMFVSDAMNHVACVVVQNRLRSLLESTGAVAFIADGAILPRKSGANNAPMASPPAVPCEAPADSTMKKTLQVDLGSLRGFLQGRPVDAAETTLFSITGMVIPKGITLIAGGGYHGKSTMLRAIAVGVYDKVPGDGREFCVTVLDTMSIRAEDGRYTNSCNVSAFISDLPTPPGVQTTIDTTHFSSSEASGSTSQAANVSEAIEMGAKVFLVDEDVSAANFMSRDGRMRSLVMDESITPLLYRVNGMYDALGISCVVVVGGVGDWLDVPNQVVLMNKYVASDATKKAASISYQFSYGHVQYAGKGVVHQLPWDKKGTPKPRRPTASFLEQFDSNKSMISLLDGGHAISIHPSDADETDSDVSMKLEGDAIYNDDDDGYIDLSRCEQLIGKKPQLFACGQCVIWLIREAKRQPGSGVADLLSKLDETIDKHGIIQIFAQNHGVDRSLAASLSNSPYWTHLLGASGFGYRPRRYEIGQSFYRMRGIKLEHIPMEDDGEEERIRLEAEKRKRELAELWAARRPKNVAS